MPIRVLGLGGGGIAVLWSCQRVIRVIMVRCVTVTARSTYFTYSKERNRQVPQGLTSPAGAVSIALGPVVGRHASARHRARLQVVAVVAAERVERLEAVRVSK